nr:MAG TPA: hypothetical protein [Caudoviricetes sp.]
MCCSDFADCKRAVLLQRTPFVTFTVGYLSAVDGQIFLLKVENINNQK